MPRRNLFAGAASGGNSTDTTVAWPENDPLKSGPGASKSGFHVFFLTVFVDRLEGWGLYTRH